MKFLHITLFSNKRQIPNIMVVIS